MVRTGNAGGLSLASVASSRRSVYASTGLDATAGAAAGDADAAGTVADVIVTVGGGPGLLQLTTAASASPTPTVVALIGISFPMASTRQDPGQDSSR